MSAQALIEQARADGLQILVDGGRVKLRGAPEIITKWTPVLRPHKAEIVEAANDARELDEGQAERAAIMRFCGEIDAPLADLLALYGGFDGVDWQGLALTGAQESDLWIAQRPNDGKLTVLATVEPIPKPVSYRQAWPARFTSPEPNEDAAPAAEAAQQAIVKARQCCWDCKHLDTHARPTCGAGHSLCWRTINPGRRTVPSRADAEPCKDKRP